MIDRLFAGRSPAEFRKDLLLGLAVAAVAFAVYANSLGNAMVWDDEPVIAGNAALRGTMVSLFNGIDLARAGELTPYYRPLTLLTFLLEQRLHGLTPALVRLCNVLLHCANAFLVFRLARNYLAERWMALLAALLFAVHPLHSEAVDFNAGGRNTMLCTFFILACYLVHRRAAAAGKMPGAVAGALLYLAGLFSKESALALLPLVCLLEMEACRPERRPGSVQHAVGRLLPYAAATACYLLLRNHALAGAGVRIEILPRLGERMLDNLFIVPRYLLTVLWPAGLSAKYFLPEDVNLLALPLFAAWLVIVCALAWLGGKGRSRATLFGIAWLVAFWLPVSGIIPIPSAPLADRYLYLPAVGLWIVAADQAGRLLPREGGRSRIALASLALLLMVLAAVTARRNRDWQDDGSLFTSVVEQYPGRAFGYHNLGCFYLDKLKNLDLAEREFNKALALDPLFPRLQTQLGYLFLQRGDYRQAVQHYQEALRINPADAEAHLNLAIALERLQRYQEAVSEYRRFLSSPGSELPSARPMAAARVEQISGLLGGRGGH